MTKIRWAPVAIALALVAAGMARAETVELRSGGTLAGDVTLGEGDAVIVDARFPTPGKVALKRGDLTPASLYQVLERRADAADAAARRELGRLAEEAGLKGAAVAEYRAVKDLDPASAKEMDDRVATLVESIAADVLQDARDLLDEGRARVAVMYLHTVVESYPGTRAAREAESLLPQATRAAGAAGEVSVKTVDAAAAPKVMDAIEAHLRKGMDAGGAVAGHESTVADEKAAERAAVHDEAAWAAAKTLPVATGDDALDARIAKLRSRARSALVDAYLTVGTIYLERRAIPDAERWCNKACELDPVNKPNHLLHRLILQAKALSIGRGLRGRTVVLKAPTDDPGSEYTVMKPSADYPLKTCVVSGEDLDSMGGAVAIMYEGTEVQFCCKGCLAKFLADPAKYLPKVKAAPR